MNSAQIVIAVILFIAVAIPLITLFYTRKIAQVDKHKYQNWR